MIKILYDYHLSKLENAVNDLIKDGYSLAGGLGVLKDYYVQVLEKDSEIDFSDKNIDKRDELEKFAKQKISEGKQYISFSCPTIKGLEFYINYAITQGYEPLGEIQFKGIQFSQIMVKAE